MKKIILALIAFMPVVSLVGCQAPESVTARDLLTYDDQLANDPRRGGSTRLDIEINRWMQLKVLPIAQCLIDGGCSSLPSDRISKQIQAKLFTPENARDLKQALLDYFESKEYRWLGRKIVVGWEDAESCSGEAWMVGGGSASFKDRRNFMITFPGHSKKLFIDIRCSYVHHSSCGRRNDSSSVTTEIIGSQIAGCLWHRNESLQQYCNVKEVKFQ
ncbi:MAG: hypothetical protein HYW49_06105 [Deltaproteobacteria bacterium]|nr:hypothetical protein [Deltaproteobacteria bacterium]